MASRSSDSNDKSYKDRRTNTKPTNSKSPPVDSLKHNPTRDSIHKEENITAKRKHSKSSSPLSKDKIDEKTKNEEISIKNKPKTELIDSKKIKIVKNDIENDKSDQNIIKSDQNAIANGKTDVKTDSPLEQTLNPPETIKTDHTETNFNPLLTKTNPPDPPKYNPPSETIKTNPPNTQKQLEFLSFPSNSVPDQNSTYSTFPLDNQPNQFHQQQIARPSPQQMFYSAQLSQPQIVYQGAAQQMANLSTAEEMDHSNPKDFDSFVVEISPSEFKAEIVVPESLQKEPTLNFVGMMIGPGGYTQKQMEGTTGCNITVRGEGSTRNNLPLDPDRKMFVLIKSNCRQNVCQAYAIIHDLLHDKKKRDALRKQQMTIRSAQMNPTSSYGANNQFYQMQYGGGYQMANVSPYQMAPQMQMGVKSMVFRSPFQNAFKRDDLGGGMVRETIIIPAVKATLLLDPANPMAEQVAYSTGTRIETKEVMGAQGFIELCLDGNPHQIAEAREKLQSVMSNEFGSNETAPMDHIMVPNTVVGLIIGKNGDTIKKFMGDTGCRIKVVPEYLTNPDNTERTVHLFGNPKQCSDAKYVINDLVNKHKTTSYSTTGNSQSRVEIVSIPCGCVGILIGKGGENIRNLSKRTNCRVQVVQYDENMLFPGGVVQNQLLRHVSMRGDETALNKARIEIQAIINEHANRHNYEAPRMDKDNGDPLLGLKKEQYDTYLKQMKDCFGMDKKQVHEYYHRMMSEIGKEPADYAAHVRQYLDQYQQVSGGYGMYGNGYRSMGMFQTGMNQS